MRWDDGGFSPFVDRDAPAAATARGWTLQGRDSTGLCGCSRAWWQARGDESKRRGMQRAAGRGRVSLPTVHAETPAHSARTNPRSSTAFPVQAGTRISTTTGLNFSVDLFLTGLNETGCKRYSQTQGRDRGGGGGRLHESDVSGDAANQTGRFTYMHIGGRKSSCVSAESQVAPRATTAGDFRGQACNAGARATRAPTRSDPRWTTAMPEIALAAGAGPISATCAGRISVVRWHRQPSCERSRPARFHRCPILHRVTRGPRLDELGRRSFKAEAQGRGPWPRSVLGSAFRSICRRSSVSYNTSSQGP